MGLVQTVRDRLGMGPSRAELASRVEALTRLHLEERAKRHGPVQSGVEMTFGRYEYETNAKLRGPGRWELLEKMEADPAVKGALRQATLPLLNADWNIQSASDSARDEEIRDFVAANLLRQSTDKYGREYWVQSPWRGQRLPEILRMLPHGFSMFAKSFRRVKGKVVFDRIQWLEPSSVDPSGWILDKANDDIIEVLRTYRSNDVFGHRKPLLAEQISLFPWEPFGARYEGRPFTRSMYGAWLRKEFEQRMQAIWTQKVGCPPVMANYPHGFPEDQIPRVEEFVKAARGESPAEAYGVFPAGSDGKALEVSYVTDGAGEVDRMRGVIEMENAEISRAGGTKTMLLGETESGSRSTGDVQGMLEFIGVEAIATHICDIAAHGIGNLRGEIAELVDLNFAGVKEYPQLVVSKLNPFQMQQEFDRQVAIWTANIVPHCPESRKQISTAAGFALPDDLYEECEEIAPPPMGTVPSQLDPEGNNARVPDRERGNTSETGDAGERAEQDRRAASVRLAARDEFAKRLAPMLAPIRDGLPKGAGHRYPNEIEATHVNLAEVERTFRVGEADVTSDLKRVKREMIAELMSRLRAGKITPRTIDTQRRSKFRRQRVAEKAITETLLRIGRSGMDHVRAEIASQVKK